MSILDDMAEAAIAREASGQHKAMIYLAFINAASKLLLRSAGAKQTIGAHSANIRKIAEEEARLGAAGSRGR